MRNFLRSYPTEARLLVVLVVLCAGLGIASDQFLTLGNIASLLNNNSVNLIWAVGLLVVLIAGGIDISFAVAASVVQYICVSAFAMQGGGNWLLGFVIAGALGIEPVNRYETHLINTGAQAKWMIEKVGVDNMFIHLDTYHMNIEEKGAGNGILDARDHLRYIHLSESDRGTPGWGTCDWDEIFATLAAIGFRGGLAMESFINMPPEVGYGLAVWRPVAHDFAEVMDNGLPFLRGQARQYRLS